MGTAQASDYLENKTVDHLFRTATFAKPAGLYVALFTAAPSDAGGGTEVAGGGYARASAGIGDANWRATQGGNSGASTGTTGLTSNAVAIVFPVPTGNWGTATHFGIFDAAAGGNLLIWDALLAPRTILLGDPAPTFPPDELKVTVS